MGKLLFLAFPALELYIMIQAGKYLGGLGVVTLVIASFLFGVWLIFRQGLQKVDEARKGLHAGRTPSQDILSGLLILLAGLLFIFPGFISDILGLCLLIPPLRGLFGTRLLNYAAQRQQKGQSGFRGMYIFRAGGAPFSQDQRRDDPQDGPHETIIDCTVEPDPAPRRNDGQA